MAYKKKTYKKKKRSVKKVERKDLPWSESQKDIFQNISGGHGNTIVMAGPGSGKTASLSESIYHVPKHMWRYTLGTAFNSSTTRTLEKHVPEGVSTLTHHAIGLRTTCMHWGPQFGLGGRGCVDTRDETMYLLAHEEIGDRDKHEKLIDSMVRIGNMSKVTLADGVEDIVRIIEDNGFPTYQMTPVDIAHHVHNMLETCKEGPRTLDGRSVISFSDMIWLPHVYGWQPPQYDYVFVDEAQDLSPARTELLLKCVRPGGRVFAFGDPKQAIYGFAGATKDSMDKLTAMLEGQQLPLGVSYRCAKEIINMAKKINPMIEAAPSAPDGVVDSLPIDQVYDHIENGTAILSRVNRPLVRMCMALLNVGYNANIQGKDIGDRFLWRIRTWEPGDVKDLIKSVRGWNDHVGEILTAKKRWDSLEQVNDEAACIEQFCEGAQSLDDVRKRIKTFFSDDDAQVKLSSAHKAKGLEWNRVLLLDKTFKPHLGGEEENIWYVALTRARNYLGIMEGKLS
jgi:DNA helicase-2/ATP-dependent DNA helicase PcrA